MAEQEIWYNADGEPVRVTEGEGKSEGVYVPPWVRRDAEKEKLSEEGRVRWDYRRTSGRYSGNYYVYPGWYSWGYPRYNYHCHRPHYRNVYSGRWGFYYRGNGVSIHYRR